MSNWTSISSADLEKIGAASVIAKAEQFSPGSTVEQIADAVAAVRAAVSTGNALDIDVTKVPNSLKALTGRIAFFALMDLVRMALTTSQADVRRFDQSRLNRILDEKIRVESPDNAASGSGEIQSQPSPSIKHHPRHFTRWQEDGI